MKKSDLDDKALLAQLEELAESLGLKVRYEKIKKEASFYPGGLCTVKGEDTFIINKIASADDKIQALAQGLGSFDLSQIYIKPALRDFLLRYSDKVQNPGPDKDPEQ
jgi:hypothetical protein